jgi:hypothetical protein
MLTVVPRSAKDERRSDHLALVAPPFDGPLEDVAGTTGLVAAPKLSVPCGSRQKAPKRTLIVRQLLDDRRLLGGLREHGDHDGVLVDIHPDMNLGRRCGHGSVLLVPATLSVACGSGTPATTGANPRYAWGAGPPISSVSVSGCGEPAGATPTGFHLLISHAAAPAKSKVRKLPQRYRESST